MDTAGFTRRLERLLADAERVTGLTIVVHDRTGAFANTLGQFHYHRHRFCAAGRSDAPGYGGRCLAHCYHAINSRARMPGCEPFVHTCWKGCSEAVAPIVRGDEHRLTLFGGPARSGPIPPEDLVPEARHAWRQLPLPDPARLAAAANLLTALGQALLVLLDGQITAGGGRKAAIDRLIEARMHAELGPAEIGQALGLSPSRAAHVVTGLYGMPFGELLRERRLARARHLLLTGDDPVGAVGRRCGFASQHWFNRIFARATGEPPARWRRRQRRQA